jgi:hypothetical protein
VKKGKKKADRRGWKGVKRWTGKAGKGNIRWRKFHMADGSGQMSFVQLANYIVNPCAYLYDNKNRENRQSRSEDSKMFAALKK